MGIEIDTSSVERMFKYIDKCIDIVNNEIMRTLTYLGEQCVIRVRDRSGDESWFDQTGNLRSSIGYAVYEYGRKQIESTFSQVLNGSEGVDNGRRMIDELAKKYATTYALVVVAGMEYAGIVEAMDNKDVLASTELWAKAKLQEYLDRAKSNALNKIKGIKL